jgi:hypothetical protein
MHVPQLRDSLGLTPNHEVVEPTLPEVALFEHAVRKRAARSGRIEHLPRESLLENLHDDRGIALFRLTDQEMKMLRHHNVAHHCEPVALAHLL